MWKVVGQILNFALLRSSTADEETHADVFVVFFWLGVSLSIVLIPFLLPAYKLHEKIQAAQKIRNQLQEAKEEYVSIQHEWSSPTAVEVSKGTIC